MTCRRTGAVRGACPDHLVSQRTGARPARRDAVPDRWPAWQRPWDALIAWSVAAKLALEHVTAGHLVPDVRGSTACWRLANPHVRIAGLRGAVRRLITCDERA
ncbi:hypothetical protein SAMN05421805_106147 [Saccharopolyspora antimicrobica]|uniref:Uncharacterized protein n=1 Tax=Saccharopolyspora antimicrobica TaxID=455193 RepID=A0A1I5B7I7_9PSEU|nr:hypothetical protein [Saccharopolyspora antimicrobica]RKT86494.1 hypothetical protein ATL45_4872 [Saccharopolyspora antimicrobica]SFN70673.1 hypothetical protein SAMN05421805_106147 [Saccharopolyspora antimicrobica]